MFEFTGHNGKNHEYLLPIPLYDDAVYQIESSRTLKKMTLSIFLNFVWFCIELY